MEEKTKKIKEGIDSLEAPDAAAKLRSLIDATRQSDGQSPAIPLIVPILDPQILNEKEMKVSGADRNAIREEIMSHGTDETKDYISFNTAGRVKWGGRQTKPTPPADHNQVGNVGEGDTDEGVPV